MKRNLLFCNQGMSLIELIVAMVVSMVIMGGIFQMFLSGSTGFSENQELARLQESARFAFEVIGRDIRMAGYAGCAGPSVETSNRVDFGHGDYDNVAHDYLIGVNAATGDIDTVTGAEVAGSSTLTVRGMAGTDFYRATASGATTITVEDATGLATGDLVMLSDCQGSDIGQITNIAGNVLSFDANNAGAPILPATLPNGPGNAVGSAFTAGYDTTAEVVPFQTVVYSLQNNGLLRSANTAPAQEIIEGVRSMQIRYGMDTNNDGDVDLVGGTGYVPSAAVADWSQVVAIRVALLLESPIIGRAPNDNASYDMNGDGDTADAVDFAADNQQRLRRVFKATFSIRSRLL